MRAVERGPAQTTSEEQGARDPAEIREEIEDRGELGETVAAVAEKTDVKNHDQVGRLLSR